MKRKTLILATVVFIMTTLAGCGQNASQEPPVATAPVETETPAPDNTDVTTPTPSTDAPEKEVLPTATPEVEAPPVTFPPLSYTMYTEDIINQYDEESYDYYYGDWFSSPASVAEDAHFLYRIFNGYVSVCYKGGLGAKVTFPSEYNGMPVRGISSKEGQAPTDSVLCEELAKVEEVIIPDTVWCLSSYSFAKYSSLKKVTLSNRLQAIHAFAFQECASLQELDIPKSVKFIGNQIIAHCPSVQKVYTHNEDICIYDYAFYASSITETTYVPADDNTPITSDATPAPEEETVIPDSVDNTEWSLKDGVLTIKNEMQMTDYSIESAPWSVYRDRVHTLVIEDGVSYIGNYAFYGFDEIKELSIPGSVKVIGGCAFSYCRRLEKAELGEGVEIIGNMAFERTLSLKKVILPTTLKRIQSASFRSAKALTQINFPEGLKYMDYNAFDSTNDTVKTKAKEIYNKLNAK